MNTYPNKRDCEHGRQRGKCADCDLLESEKECDRYRRALTDIAERGGVTRNGRQCQEMAQEALKQFKADLPAGPLPGDQFVWHTGECVTVVYVDGAMTNLRFNRNDGPMIAVPTGLLTEDKRIKAINQPPNTGKGN